MQASEESEIVGIIRRSDEGLLERCEQANVDSDECVTLIKVASGLVVVIGPVSETDASAIENLLSDSHFIVSRNQSRSSERHSQERDCSHCRASLKESSTITMVV